MRRRFLDPRPQPFSAHLGFFVAQGHDVDELAVADCSSGLGEDDPCDLGLLRTQVEIAKVAEEKQGDHQAVIKDLAQLCALLA